MARQTSVLQDASAPEHPLSGAFFENKMMMFMSETKCLDLEISAETEIDDHTSK